MQVIELVPPLWPVNGMASFLVRSFRRTQHALLEGKIVKNISVGQNLEVTFPPFSFWSGADVDGEGER